MSNFEINHELNIEDKIHEIRGVQVMLDSDLAQVYGCANGTKTINQAVKRHINKFPEDFCFQLTELEAKNLWSQVGTANNMSRTNPYVFTEEGVAMIATIIKTPIAEKISVSIMRAFVRMRHYLKYNDLLLPNKILLLEDKIDKNTKRINELFDKFNPNDIVKDKIFFNGELYDAYSFIIDILTSSKETVIIIDNYIDKKLLDTLRSVNRKILIITKNVSNTLKEKYCSQYKNIKFIYNNSFHDRFIILDDIKLYACGASLKDVGKKCFYIGEIKDNQLLNDMLKKINEIREIT